MHLSSLSQIIKIEKTHNFKNDKFFSSITSNSKLTNKNTIFLYDNNSKSSITYIREAIKNKTPAIILINTLSRYQYLNLLYLILIKKLSYY